jgi:hypothetical protein
LQAELRQRGLAVRTYPKGNDEARRVAVEDMGRDANVLFEGAAEYGTQEGPLIARTK